MSLHTSNRILTAFRDIWTSPKSFTTTLVTSLVDHYGTECFEWLPMTIRKELQSDLGIEIPSLNFDRAMVGVQLITSDYFYKSLPSFNEYCQVLAGHSVHYDTFSMADALDIAWGITEGVLLSPPDDGDDEPFSEEIIGFIGQVVKSEGILDPPDVLKIGQIGQELASQVRFNFSDDPEMFSAIWKQEQSKGEEITAIVKEGIVNLVLQLEKLELINGQTADISKKLRTNISSLGPKK